MLKKTFLPVSFYGSKKTAPKIDVQREQKLKRLMQAQATRTKDDAPASNIYGTYIDIAFSAEGCALRPTRSHYHDSQPPIAETANAAKKLMSNIMSTMRSGISRKALMMAVYHGKAKAQAIVMHMFHTALSHYQTKTQGVGRSRAENVAARPLSSSLLFTAVR